MPKPHSESAYAPICTPENGAWFAISFVRHTQREARADFVRASAPASWRDLQKVGWRIVRVKVIAAERAVA